MTERLRVVHPDGTDVPADGETVSEIVCRGNTVMLGYYKNDLATADPALAGWLRTGDLGAVYPDGYIEIRDRSKDLIISGGENIASVEVERVLDSHPAIAELAVVERTDERWGEVPIAFVALRVGAQATPTRSCPPCARGSLISRLRKRSTSWSSRRPRPGISKRTSCRGCVQAAQSDQSTLPDEKSSSPP